MFDLDASLFEQRIYDFEEKCLVLFSRKDCHVCQNVHPKLEEIEQDYEDSDFSFYHVDIEKQPALFKRFELKGVPQVLFFSDGELKGKLAGDKEEDEYIDKIEELLED